ncbi:putative JmjC domain-containing histone demethylation protein 2C [Anabarilius grahami]|uniref:Putative JmjC domain-containing histone demethylation protein 2C n=1 Tax=Anabarilius grahami TaxID=495550 RepID=A0A3N0Y4H5_ANAGA|nr:putative JmjC domain-containing histone demethylation protein 2C [Anabarilius grahami]
MAVDGFTAKHNSRTGSFSTMTVYVEFDDLEWEKREWVKVYEDFQIFLLEHQLVWAKRKEGAQLQGTKAKQIQWPALFSLSALYFVINKNRKIYNFDGIDEPVVVSAVGKKLKSSKCNHLREEIKKMRHSSREKEKCRLLLVPR